MPETYEQMIADSDRIFTAITSGGFDNYDDAKMAVLTLWVPDFSFSRSGISHALKRLENHYMTEVIQRNIRET